MKTRRTLATLLCLNLLYGGLIAFPETAQPSDGPNPPPAGFRPPPMELPHLDKQKMPEKFQALVLPTRLDWREYGKVTSVKNQGNCGSCYAFAAVANIESKMLMDGAGTFDFSENNAKECNWYETGCEAAAYWQLASFFSERGLALESCDPYIDSETACNSACPYVKTLLEWRLFCGGQVPDTDFLKSYLYSHGPVQTNMYMGDNNDKTWLRQFADYDGSYTLYYDKSQTTNHCVLLVGWDDNLTHAGGQGGWIVKNSWGNVWGGTCGYGSEGGYFTIAYGSAGMGAWSSFMHEWQEFDPHGDLFHYDEGGWSYNYGWGDVTAWGLCKFVPAQPVTLTRVEFWTNDATSDVDIFVYDGFEGWYPRDLLAERLNLMYDEAGYHSVPLESPLFVSAGEDIYVAIQFTNRTYGYPVVIDNQGPPQAGVSFASHYGNTWFELGESAGFDVAIRIRTGSTLMITIPNGGETWMAGESRIISWTSFIAVPDVRLEYSTNGGSDWMTIVDSTPNYGSYAWTVPEVSSSSCLMRITDAARPEQISDVSDSPFTINTGTSARGDVNRDGNINVLDMLTVANHLLNIALLDEAQRLIADCNGDGSVNVLDMVSIANVILGIFPECPGNGERPIISPEVMDLFESLEAYLPADAFEQLMAMVKLETVIPGDIALAQNWPNPFNPTTSIQFAVGSGQSTAHTTLKVYNLLGQEVKTLVDEVREPGVYTVQWDASHMPSGVYFCRIESAGFAQTRSMVLLK